MRTGEEVGSPKCHTGLPNAPNSQEWRERVACAAMRIAEKYNLNENAMAHVLCEMEQDEFVAAEFSWNNPSYLATIFADDTVRGRKFIDEYNSHVVPPLK